MRTLAVVNPRSSAGRTGKEWPEIERELNRAIGPLETAVTDAPMDAAYLTAKALRDGVEQIVAVGGDGTLNEVVNGFFEGGHLINEEAVVATLMNGTGGDFRRGYLHQWSGSCHYQLHVR